MNDLYFTIAMSAPKSAAAWAIPDRSTRLSSDAPLHVNQSTTPQATADPVTEYIKAGALPRPRHKCCERCSKRKIRCDRRTPCLNCRKADTTCIAARQNHTHVDRRSRKRLQISRTELIDRLAELENKLGLLRPPVENRSTTQRAPKSGCRHDALPDECNRRRRQEVDAPNISAQNLCSITADGGNTFRRSREVMKISEIVL